ncbi:MAG: hypothetical protein ACTSR0_01080 [Candidatus Asgardarchaeia archaeon]
MEIKVDKYIRTRFFVKLNLNKEVLERFSNEMKSRGFNVRSNGGVVMGVKEQFTFLATEDSLSLEGSDLQKSADKMKELIKVLKELDVKGVDESEKGAAVDFEVYSEMPVLKYLSRVYDTNFLRRAKIDGILIGMKIAIPAMGGEYAFLDIRTSRDENHFLAFLNYNTRKDMKKLLSFSLRAPSLTKKLLEKIAKTEKK